MEDKLKAALELIDAMSEVIDVLGDQPACIDEICPEEWSKMKDAQKKLNQLLTNN